MKHLLTISLILITLNLSAQIEQWRGPQRDGHYPDVNLLQSWPENGPVLITKFENLPGGYSTPVYYKDIIYITGRKDSLNILSALKIDGTVVWQTVYGKAWDQSYPESRNTPTIEDDRIYISSGMGEVNCIDAISGGIVWSVDAHKIYGGEFHRWGFAESLVITDKAVLASPTGNETMMIALDKTTGELIWKTESLGDIRSYTSPLLINHKGRNIILSVSSIYAAGVDPMDGKILWKYDLVAHTGEGRRNNTVTPLYHNGEIFLTSGYDATAVMLSLSDDGESVTLKWVSDVLDTHHGGVVLVDGYIYGSNWINNGNGNWICLDWETGEVMFDEKWHNKGSIIYADNRLYIYDEKNGNVGLIEATPSGFNLKGSFRITDGTGPHWAHPSIFDSKLFIRHGEVLLVFDIGI